MLPMVSIHCLLQEVVGDRQMRKLFKRCVHSTIRRQSKRLFVRHAGLEWKKAPLVVPLPAALMQLPSFAECHRAYPLVMAGRPRALRMRATRRSVRGSTEEVGAIWHPHLLASAERCWMMADALVV